MNITVCLNAPPWKFYNSCDGMHARDETNEEIRKLPTGGGANALLCKVHWWQEFIYRTNRNSLDKTKFDRPGWDTLEIVEPALPWIEVSERWYNYSLEVLPPIYGPRAGVFAVGEPVDHVQDIYGKYVPTFYIYAEHATRYYVAYGTADQMKRGKIVWRPEDMKGR